MEATNNLEWLGEFGKIILEIENNHKEYFENRVSHYGSKPDRLIWHFTMSKPKPSYDENRKLIITTRWILNDNELPEEIKTEIFDRIGIVPEM